MLIGVQNRDSIHFIFIFTIIHLNAKISKTLLLNNNFVMQQLAHSSIHETLYSNCENITDSNRRKRPTQKSKQRNDRKIKKGEQQTPVHCTCSKYVII